MHSTRDPKETDRADVPVERADDELARAHEQIMQILRANEQLSELEYDVAHHPSHPQVNNTRGWPLQRGSALRGVIGLSLKQIKETLRANKRLSGLEHDAARHPSDLRVPLRSRPALRGLIRSVLGRIMQMRANEELSEPKHDAARRPTSPQIRVNTRRWPLRRRPALPGLIGLLLAAGICIAAFALQRPTPRLDSASSLPPEKSALSAQPSPPVGQVADANAELSQPAPLARIPPQDVAPTAAPMSADLVQLLQTMSRDLVNMQQGIEQLKTSQEQAARENAKTTEQLKASQEQIARESAATIKQLKASQEQMARVIAKASEQNRRPTPSAPPPRPTATSASKPVAAVRSPRATERPPAPIQSDPEEQ